MTATIQERSERLLKSVPTAMLIGGEWVQSSSRGMIEVDDPATREVIATVPDGTPEDGARAMRCAVAAQKLWASTSLEERSEILRRAWEKITARSEDLAMLVTLENGKPLSEARAEVAYAAEFFRWFSHQAVRIRGQFGPPPKGVGRVLVMEQPVGPALLITPWNFPIAMLTRKIGPAIAAGCTMVVKPAGETPLSALMMCSILSEAGLPDGVLNVVTTKRSSDVVKTIVDTPGLRKISFTGSTQVGKQLLHRAADHVLRSSMELGGNAPFVVFADADMDVAIEGAMVAKMRNGGESCIAANRMYVERRAAREFSERLADRMKDLKIGHGIEDGVQVGPLINEDGRAKVEELVSDMVSHGASVVTGGQRGGGRGYFYQPTVVTNVALGSRVLNEEIFGPVAPILTFEREQEAIDLANQTPFGLAAYVFTNDLARAVRVSESIEVGMVGVNSGFISNPAAPFGGVKESGLGREGGEQGIHEFLETKYVYLNV